MSKFKIHSSVNNLFLLLLLLCPVRIGNLWAETILYKNGDRIYGTVIDQSTDKVIVLKDDKKQSIPKSLILKIIFKDVKDETEINRIVEAEKKKLNKEGKKTEKEEQLDTILLEQMIKENSYKIVQKRLALVEKYLEEQDASWEEYITAKRSPWDPVWRAAILPGWGLSHMRQNGYARTYQTFFVLSLLAYVGLDRAAHDRSDKYKEKTNDLIFKDPLIYSQVNAALPAATAQLFIQQDQISKLESLNSIKNQEHRYSADGHAALGITVWIYALQLAHSYFTGRNWAKHNVIETPSGESASAGFNFKNTYGPIAAGGAAMREYRSEVRYVTLF